MDGVGLYTDDSYYWPSADTIVPAELVYDRNAREFIFLEDTTQYPDTVVMIIKNWEFWIRWNDMPTY